MDPRVSIYNIEGFENAENGYVEDLSNSAINGNKDRWLRVSNITTYAAVSRNRDESSNPKARFDALKKEAALNTCGRPFEFVGCIVNFYHKVGKDGRLYVILDLSTDTESKEITMDYHKFANSIGKFGFIERVDNGMYQIKTNLRAMINAGIDEKDVPFNRSLDGFRVFKLEIPMFVFNQFITHTMISKESRSERVITLDDSKYWIPEDFVEKLMSYEVEFKKVAARLEGDDELASRTISAMRALRTQYEDSKDYPSFIKVMLMQPADAMSMVFKVLGCKKEIYQRSMLELRYKKVIMGAWEHDLTWKNLLLERGGTTVWKNWVQPETKKVAEVLAKFLLA